MKRTMILSAVAIIMIGIIIGFNVFFNSSDDENVIDESNELGYRLSIMEQETDYQVKSITEQIQQGYASEEDCQAEIGSMVKNILYNLPQLENKEANHINLAYNANVIRKLAHVDRSEKEYTKEEREMRGDMLAGFCNKFHSYYIDMTGNSNERGDYLELVKEADKIEDNLDVIVADYVEKIFAYYKK